jgi:hypothetical protein
LRALFTHHDDADSKFLRNVGTYKQTKICDTSKGNNIHNEHFSNLKSHYGSYLDFHRTLTWITKKTQFT